MRKIAFVAGVVGAAVVVLRNLQGQLKPAYTGQPLSSIKPLSTLPFDAVDEKQMTAQTVADDLPLSNEPVVIDHETEALPAEVLREPLLNFAQMPVDDIQPAEAVIEPQIVDFEPNPFTAQLEIPLDDETKGLIEPQIVDLEPESEEELFADQLPLEDDDQPQFEEIEPENDLERFADELELPLEDELIASQIEMPESSVPKWTGDVYAKEVFNGQVVHFHSADTFEVQREDTNEIVQFRLWGVNSGRPSQPFGAEALEFSKNFVKDRFLSFEIRQSFREGQRLVGWAIADGEALNVALLESGLARWYSEIFPDEVMLAEIEAQARAAQRGLWNA